MVKLHPDKLKSIIFTHTGVKDLQVLVSSQIGEDAAIIDLGNLYLAFHTDPITGAVEDIGWLAIHIPANDLAVRGIKPRWFTMSILLPENFNDNDLIKIMNDIDNALKEIEASLVDGHTEYAPGIDKPIISSTAIGIGSKYVSTKNAKIGDYVIMTKYVALESTAILAKDFEKLLIEKGLSKDLIEKAKTFRKYISIVKEALTLTPYVNSMHDPTEGGIIQGVLEIAIASNKTIEIYLENVLIKEETQKIFQILNLNPYKSLSSGTLIATIPREKIDQALQELSKLNIPYSIIGKVIDNKPKVIVYMKDHVVEELNENDFIEDELMKFWSRMTCK